MSKITSDDKFYMCNKQVFRRADIDLIDKVVLSVIIDYIRDNERGWPSHDRIAKDIHVSRDSVIRATKQLEKSGDLIIKRRGRGKSNYYYLPEKQSQNATTLNTKQSQNATRSSSKLQPQAVANCNTKETQEGDEKKETHNLRAKPKKSHVDDHRFNEFWDSYPRKAAKEVARKAWVKLKPSNDLIQVILANLKLQCRSDQWQKDNGKYIPHASTWLNGRRWEDILPGGQTDDELSSMTTRPLSVDEANELLSGIAQYE